MKTIDDIKSLDGYKFEKLMNGILDAGYTEVYTVVTQFIFAGADSIHESWDDDFDDVWDAEYTLMEICGQDENLAALVLELINRQ